MSTSISVVQGPKRTTDRDVRIGERIRARREAMRVSQSDLGKAIGVTFQQIQKYEQGKNRIGAGRLQDVAELLGVSVVSFYDPPGDLRALEPPPQTVAQAEAALLKASDALAEAKVRAAAALLVAA